MAANVTAPTASAFGFSGPDWIGYNILRNDAKDNYSRETEFTREMASTQWQRATKDMMAAGLNPMLAYDKGPNAAPQSPQRHNVTPPGLGGNMQLQTAEQGQVLQADANLKNAQADATRETLPVTLASMRQNISESAARIEGIYADIQQKASTAALNYQHIENLKQQIPPIKADITKTLAQAKKFIAETNLTNAEEKLAQQRLKQDLPQIERTAAALRVRLDEMLIPGRMADEAAQDSFIGQLGAYARALNPFAQLLGGAVFGAGLLKGQATNKASGLINKGLKGGPDIHRR